MVTHFPTDSAQTCDKPLQKAKPYLISKSVSVYLDPRFWWLSDALHVSLRHLKQSESPWLTTQSAINLSVFNGSPVLHLHRLYDHLVWSVWKDTDMNCFKIMSQNLPTRTKQNHEISQDNWFPGQDSNSEHPNLEAGVKGHQHRQYSVLIRNL
jgi:hypothetical protein